MLVFYAICCVIFVSIFGREIAALIVKGPSFIRAEFWCLLAGPKYRRRLSAIVKRICKRA
jgi:hypothetical protein